jgi:hypothetical protein
LENGKTFQQLMRIVEEPGMKHATAGMTKLTLRRLKRFPTDLNRRARFESAGFPGDLR